MGAHPELGLGLRAGRAAEQRRNRLARAPRVVSYHPLEAHDLGGIGHGSRIAPRTAGRQRASYPLPGLSFPPPGDATLLAHLARTLRTAAHLRPEQIAWRVFYSLRRPLWERRSAGVDAAYRRRADALGPVQWSHAGLAAVSAWRARRRDEATARSIARDAREHRFTFLGRTEHFAGGVDWFRPDLDTGTRLWKTHLHEFSYAEDLARAAAAGEPGARDALFALVESFDAAAPIGCPGFALDAWNARAVATRLVHWAVAGQRLGLGAGDGEAGRLGRNLAVHALFLRDNLERDLCGNHLLRDCTALVFAHELMGAVPDALALLERQVAEQVLPDGCHVERAPMYHALCLSDLFEAALLLGERTPPWLQKAVARMAGWLEAVRLGDGEIPLLGDGWLGEVDVGALLEAVPRVATPEAQAAPERHGGIVALRAGAWRAVVRAGAHGPDYLLGHAHADLLSFDASREAERVVTDSGTHTYDPGPERQRLRATAAHNTLRLDGEEQLEAWGSFRVGRRGRARVLARGDEQGFAWLSACHDAYRRLPGRPIHHRLVAVCDRGVLVLDAVLGRGLHRVESRLNEHPDGGPRVRIAALGGPATTCEVPLHEHHGESRPMTQHLLESDLALPGCRGWIVWDAARFETAGAGIDADLQLREGRVTLRLRAPEPIALEWRPGETREGAAVTLSLCSRERGSAN